MSSLVRKKIIVWKPPLIGNLVNCMKDQLGDVTSSWDHSMCRLDRLYQPPHLSCLICGESYTAFLLSPEEQLLRTQCRCHSVLWHTGSSHIIFFIISYVSLLHLKKNKLTLFRLPLCLFLTPLAFKSCFPTLLWAFLATSLKVQHPTWPSQEPTDLSGLGLDSPPELA